MSTGINVGSGNWSKLGKNTGVNIDSKMETESQSWGIGFTFIIKFNLIKMKTYQFINGLILVKFKVL